MILKHIYTYEEKGRFYMKLTYVYEDVDGNEHTRIYPRVDFPIRMCEDVPLLIHEFFAPHMIGENDPMVSYGDVFVHAGSVSVPINNCAGIVERMGPCPKKEPVPDISTDVSRYNRYDDVCFVDYISKPRIKEMTLEEIEKKLGYKVKIVSDKKEEK